MKVAQYRTAYAVSGRYRIVTAHAATIEAFWKCELAPWCLRGEWFYLPVGLLDLVKNATAELEAVLGGR